MFAVNISATVLLQEFSMLKKRAIFADNRNKRGWELGKDMIEPVFKQENDRMELSGAVDLSGADLSQHDLSGLNLTGADLSGANLSGAKLSKTILLNANLSGAILCRANLRRANLSGANLSSANLDEIRAVRACFEWPVSRMPECSMPIWNSAAS